MRFFRSKEEEAPNDVKSIRDALLYFIRRQLSGAEGGEGGHIRGVHLFLVPDAIDRPLYEAAVYHGDEERFRSEVQRIADDYALDLPANWELEVAFAESLPAQAAPVPQVKAGVWISTVTRSKPATAAATIVVLEGEAEQQQYALKSGGERINIGRDKKVQLPGGFFRENDICFPAASEHAANKFISRQHAHIQFDGDTGQFLLFADEGGIPPGNKIKVKRRAEAQPVKLQSTYVPHMLMDGDQIILGESALLEFRTEA